MANQMIALQARNPQISDPQQRTARLANMVNMARQAEASQLQGERTRQEMDYAAAAEGRAAQTHTSSQKKAELEYVGLATEQFRQDVAKLKEGDIAGAEALRADIVAKIPSWNSYIRPASEWTPEYTAQLMSKASEIVAQTYPDAKSVIEYAAKGGVDAQGRPVPEGTPIQVVTGRRPSTTPIPAAGAPAPTATPTAPPTAAPAPTAVGEYGEAKFVPDSAVPLSPYQQEHIREMQSGLGMSQPASFSPSANAGQMTPDVMSQIVNSAFETGVMAQVDFDQLLASQAPQNKQALVDSFRRANITLQADAPSLADSAMSQQQPITLNPVQTPQSRTANLGGEMPMMRNTMAQYQPVQRRDPSAAPTPGIYNVPTQDVAATSRATRPSKQELYDAEAAKIKAVRDAGPAPLTSLQKRARQTQVAKAYTQTQGLINKTYDPKEGVIALARKIKMLSPDQKEALTGFSNYVPSFRESSREADTLFGNLKGVVTAAGKDAAAASGTIGPMAVQEWKIVADQIANLDLANMTPRALDAQMDRIIRQVGNATKLAQQVYDVQYGDDLKEYPDFKLRGLPSPTAKTPVTKAPAGVSAAEWKAMTPAERKLWQ